MNKIFPPMLSKPEKIQIFALIPGWIWVFVLFPMFMPFVGLGIWEEVEISVWLEIIYHVANGVLMFFLFLGYLKEEWFMLTTDFRYYLKHIALTVGLIMLAEFVLLRGVFLFDFLGFETTNLLECLPAVEMSLSLTPLYLIMLQPLLGTIIVSVFVPISICALFYCFGFAPICCKKPWVAYLCIAILTLIPHIINILWRGQVGLELSTYFIRLPLHLLMCWSYQKTDNVFTPLISLSIVNLLTSVVLITL